MSQGDPGNPLMCQLQKSYLWVLRGILVEGGERCPGLFLYIKVEDYSDWIASKTRMPGLPLSALYHWENSVPFHSYLPPATVAPIEHAELGPVTWTQTQVPIQESTTAMTSEPENSSEESEESSGEDVRETSGEDVRETSSLSEEAMQPDYLDYYREQQAGQAGEAGEHRSLSGQDGLLEPRELTLFALVFSFALG